MTERECLYERLLILEKADLITSQVTAQVKKILNLLAEQERRLDPEKLETFITHIALALQRIDKGQYEEPLNEAVLEELKVESAYPEAERFAAKFKNAVNVDIPKTEEEYLLVHLCNLFS